MKYFLPILLALTIVACETTQETGSKTEKKPVQNDISTGWVGDDTYTVRAYGTTIDDAIDNAKHRILKDIVNVRVRNSSPFTDISKISNEFSTPLRNGKVIQKQNKGDKLEIYFRIRDKGLKAKFMRK